MPADGKAEAGAAVFARGRGIRLGEFLEQPPHLLVGHADAGVGHGNRDPVAAIALLRLRGDGDGAFLGELVGVARQVEQRLPEAGLVGVDRAEVGRAIDDDPIAVLRRHRLDRLGHVLDQRRQRERFEVKLHAPRLDLRQVEDVVDQREQVAARAEHAIERLDVLLQRLGILPQHLGDADDGVERRAQLVAHVGEELRLVLARLCELAALVLDFVEQPHVLDRDHRLVGEGRDQLDLLVGERPHLGARQRENADRHAFAQHRNAEHGAKTAQLLRFGERVFRVGQHIGNMDDSAFEQGASGDVAATRLDRHISGPVHEFGARSRRSRRDRTRRRSAA